MIDLRELAKYQYSDDEIRITCTDGQIIEGDLVSIDDEEESGLGELGISIFTPQGGYVGLALSEIDSVSEIPNREKVLREA